MWNSLCWRNSVRFATNVKAGCHAAGRESRPRPRLAGDRQVPVGSCSFGAADCWLGDGRWCVVCLDAFNLLKEDSHMETMAAGEAGHPLCEAMCVIRCVIYFDLMGDWNSDGIRED